MTTAETTFDPTVCADALLAARRTGSILSDVPAAAEPRNEAEAAQVQDLVARALGPVAAWKVGAASLEATPFRAPIHAETVFVDPGRVAASRFRHIGVEAEIVYRFDRDLPPRTVPYSRDEVLAAVGSMHPAIEICDTRFARLDARSALLHRADQGNHGALIVGPAQTTWRTLDPVHQRARLEIDQRVVTDVIGGNSAVDPVRLLIWLADVGAIAHGGIRAGQWVTTGSCSGTVPVAAPTRLVADFPGIGRVDVAID